MHFVYPDPDGPIRQEHRAVSQKVNSSDTRTQVICSGNNLRVACQPNRKCLSRSTGRGKRFRLLELFMATGQVYHEVDLPGGGVRRLELVTCPRCKASEAYRRASLALQGV
jgi:hypothetical protein